MKTLLSSPAQAVTSIQNAGDWIDQFFSSPFTEFNGFKRMQTIPVVNVTENHKSYLARLAAPGLNKENFNISVAENLLTIAYEDESRTESEDENLKKEEYNFSSWSRSFNIPKEVEADRISAVYKDGILEVNIPKKTPSSPVKTEKKITVN
jgi:HSP20 family protein